MRTSLLASLALAGSLCAIPAFAQQGSPPTTPTGVTRVTLIRIKTGHAPQFWNDMRQHMKPIYEEFKRKGIISDYSVSNKLTTDSENDWNVVWTVTYKTWSALDDLAMRTDPITLAHYGSADQRTAAGRERSEHGTTVSSFLVRNVTVNDWK